MIFHSKRRIRLSVKLIQEKAISLFDHLKTKVGESSASPGWFCRFKRRANLLHLDLEEDDFEELLESHEEELTNEELMELEQMQRTEEHEEEEESVPVKKFDT